MQGAGLERAGAVEGRAARAWGQGPSCPQGEVPRQPRKLEQKEARNPNESERNQLKQINVFIERCIKKVIRPNPTFCFYFSVLMILEMEAQKSGC